ncbi:tubulin tyrosine ligase-like 15 isoform X2 [Haematobia irritans]|uniref:tubulin tyrosine ligase-like 15 isoform X2 n=1 Tax=Haematobia irritans TaxID=7368 RepID=UPI003F4F91AD
MDNELRTRNNRKVLGLHTCSSIPLKSMLIFVVASVLSTILYDIAPVRFTSNLYWNNVGILAKTESDVMNVNSPKTYAIYGLSTNEDHLKHVKNILEKLGYVRTGLENNWNLLWAHDYPFKKMSQSIKNLGKHQTINHFPGCGFLTNKVDLSITQLPFIPRAFRLPLQNSELLKYARQNPLARFVEKHNEHREIVIRSPDQINMNSNNSFVQEFVQNPFLVDGHKFDIGVYVVITSINPLRVYIYSGDVLFRYCAVKYYPLNVSNVDQYVVGDDYLPTWQVPSLKKYYSRLNGGMRGAFDAYVQDRNRDPSIIWTQVEEIIRKIILAKEQDIANVLRSYRVHNFFDLMRFDFIVDENLRVYLMEANMSPNLSSAHFRQNSLLYEQLLYSVLNLVGMGSPVKQSFATSERRLNKVTQQTYNTENINESDGPIQHTSESGGHIINLKLFELNLKLRLNLILH